MLGRLNKEMPVIVEIGAETSHDATLELINRGHSWRDVEDAVKRLHEAGLSTGLHLIAGLPGETPEMMLETVRKGVALPIDSIKLHHLQILKNTRLAQLWESGKLSVEQFTVEKYIDLCIKIINLVPRKIAIERFLASSPPDKVISPHWGLKNHEFTNILKNRLKQNKIKRE